MKKKKKKMTHKNTNLKLMYHKMNIKIVIYHH